MKKGYHADNSDSERRTNSLTDGKLNWLRSKIFLSLLSLLVLVILEAKTISAQSLKPVVFAVSATDVLGFAHLCCRGVRIPKSRRNRFKNCRDSLRYRHERADQWRR